MLERIRNALGKKPAERIPLPPKEIRYPPGHGGFEAGGRAVFDQLVGFGGLKPTDAVLDAGCGVGRVARHLAGVLSGPYEGFDVVPAAVAWSQDNITARYPNFRFALAELQNQKYNRGAANEAAEYRWPYADSSFDFVFAASLFTHLLPDAFENYVREATRVVKPGGRVLATYFLLNDESLGLQEDENSRWRFAHPVEEGCAAHFPDAPEEAIAYDEGRVRRLYAETGLGLIGVRYGGWCRPVADYHQDVLLASKIV